VSVSVGDDVAVVLLNSTPIDPIKAFFWGAVINGIFALQVMGMMMMLASRPEVVGRFTLSMGPEAGGLAEHPGHSAGRDRHVATLGR
jgi:hypothetical protein